MWAQEYFINAQGNLLTKPYGHSVPFAYIKQWLCNKNLVKRWSISRKLLLTGFMKFSPFCFLKIYILLGNNQRNTCIPKLLILEPTRFTIFWKSILKKYILFQSVFLYCFFSSFKPKTETSKSKLYSGWYKKVPLHFFLWNSKKKYSDNLVTFLFETFYTFLNLIRNK